MTDIPIPMGLAFIFLPPVGGQNSNLTILKKREFHDETQYTLGPLEADFSKLEKRVAAFYASSEDGVGGCFPETLATSTPSE